MLVFLNGGVSTFESSSDYYLFHFFFFPDAVGSWILNVSMKISCELDLLFVFNSLVLAWGVKRYVILWLIQNNLSFRMSGMLGSDYLMPLHCQTLVIQKELSRNPRWESGRGSGEEVCATSVGIQRSYMQFSIWVPTMCFYDTYFVFVVKETLSISHDGVYQYCSNSGFF